MTSVLTYIHSETTDITNKLKNFSKKFILETLMFGNINDFLHFISFSKEATDIYNIQYLQKLLQNNNW